jgi:hypothetical protein
MNLSNKNYVTVTALFDIGRDRVDGRTLKDYLSWLATTLSIIPNLIVFHDGSADSIATQRFLKVEKEDLKYFKLQSQVSNILKKYATISQDISLQLPEYSLVQFSKFELMRKAIDETGAQSALWVDAGISRFLENRISGQKFTSSNISSLILHKFHACFEIDVKRNFNLSHFSIDNSKPTTSHRVVSGTSFWLTSSALSEITWHLDSLLGNWLEQEIWDNEQVAIRNILPFLQSKSLYLNQGRQETGTVARFLNSKKVTFYVRIKSILIRYAITRSR